MKDIALLVRLEKFRYLYVLFQLRIFKNGKLFLKVRNILETLILISTFIWTITIRLSEIVFCYSSLSILLIFSQMLCAPFKTIDITSRWPQTKYCRSCSSFVVQLNGYTVVPPFRSKKRKWKWKSVFSTGVLCSVFQLGVQFESYTEGYALGCNIILYVLHDSIRFDS